MVSGREEAQVIDTNTIASANETALAAKAVAQQWWPTACAVAVIVARELRNFNQWLVGVAEFVIRHGGAGMIFKKVIWNPDADQNRLK